MSMTKAEKAMLDAMRTRLALRWPDYSPTPIDPASMRFTSAGELYTAWWFNLYRKEVGQGCFGSTFHSTRSTTKTDSQTRGGPWYASEADALRAMRLQATAEAAVRLRQIDEMIEKAGAS